MIIRTAVVLKCLSHGTDSQQGRADMESGQCWRETSRPGVPNSRLASQAWHEQGKGRACRGLELEPGGTYTYLQRPVGDRITRDWGNLQTVPFGGSRRIKGFPYHLKGWNWLQGICQRSYECIVGSIEDTSSQFQEYQARVVCSLLSFFLSAVLVGDQQIRP